MTVLVMGALTGLFLWLSTLDAPDSPPVAIMLVCAALPILVIAGVVLALMQRIQEIGKGEEDDAKNY